VLRRFYSYKSCPVFYSGDNIIDPSNATEQADDTPFVRWNIKNVTGDADDVRLITGLIRELLVDTVDMAASTAPRRFATGVMNSGRTFPTMYSMAQCTPDLSASDCLACLRRLVGMVKLHHGPADGSADPRDTVLFQVRGLLVLRQPAHASCRAAIGAGASSSSSYRGQ
jgi:hypothetical protein